MTVRTPGVAAQPTVSWGRRIVFSGSDHSIIYPMELPRDDFYWNRRVIIDRLIPLEHRFWGRKAASRFRRTGTALLASLGISWTAGGEGICIAGSHVLIEKIQLPCSTYHHTSSSYGRAAQMGLLVSLC